jgi:putative transposase
MEKLCGLFGKTRVAIYDHQKREQAGSIQQDIVLYYVQQIRAQLPRLGTRKLHYKLMPLLSQHSLKVGRDYLFDLLEGHKLLIRQRKRKAITTDSRHWMRKYANQIKGMEIIRPEQVWVSDITYIRLNNQWGYLSLITDGYSRLIMGYSFRTDLAAQGCIDALNMALKARVYPELPLIHHSDRGSQYCCELYVQMLLDHHMTISMTQNGDPYENALAERVNGIIKNEFNLHECRTGFEVAQQRITDSIRAYNEQRPHSSCNFLTPQQAHHCQGELQKKWKNYPYKKQVPPHRTRQMEFTGNALNQRHISLQTNPCIVTAGLNLAPVKFVQDYF